MLDKVRLGIVDEELTEVLNSRVIGTEDDIDHSHGCIIVALRCERDYWNDRFLQKMEGEEHVFEAIDTDGVETHSVLQTRRKLKSTTEKGCLINWHSKWGQEWFF